MSIETFIALSAIAGLSLGVVLYLLSKLYFLMHANDFKDGK